MYAIIKTGGKQYRVAVGDIIDIELLKEERRALLEDNDALNIKLHDAYAENEDLRKHV